MSADPYKPYEEGATTVIAGAPEMPIASGEVTEEGCLQVSNDDCVPVEREGRYCTTDSGPVDAVVVDGRVVQVVCYEDTTHGQTGPTMVAPQNGNLDLPQNANGSVLVFPTDTRTDIGGNVVLDANDVSLYGAGPDSSIIMGDLVIQGNNARIRGVRVKGNVVFSLNTASLVFAVVEGNVVIDSNNSLAAEVDVFGNLEVTGNNVVLTNVGVAGEWKIQGNGAVCEGNHRFADENGDHVVLPEEEGEALTCR